MKGISLPVNMIVIIAIAVLVLVVVAAFFTAQTGSGFGNIALEEAFNRGCVALRTTHNCVNFNFPVSYREPGESSSTTLFSRICTLRGLTPDLTNTPTSCGRVCGCPVLTGTP